jgi:hypothetical protein
MTVLFDGQVFVFEFKVVALNPAGAALQQIRDMGCANKYKGRGEPMHQIGVEFSMAEPQCCGVCGGDAINFVVACAFFLNFRGFFCGEPI